MKVEDMEGEGLRVYGRWQKLSDYNNKMKILRWALLPVLALSQDPLKSEVERAFLHMDLDGNGIVTKAQIIQSMMKDIESHNYIDGKVEQIITAIETMVEKHDKNHNGFDFLEMYTASGGKLQDL